MQHSACRRGAGAGKGVPGSQRAVCLAPMVEVRCGMLAGWLDGRRLPRPPKPLRHQTNGLLLSHPTARAQPDYSTTKQHDSLAADEMTGGHVSLKCCKVNHATASHADEAGPSVLQKQQEPVRGVTRVRDARSRRCTISHFQSPDNYTRLSLPTPQLGRNHHREVGSQKIRLLHAL